jgi:hypothetical protein
MRDIPLLRDLLDSERLDISCTVNACPGQRPNHDSPTGSNPGIRHEPSATGAGESCPN